MADDRLFLRCKTCGETLFLWKHYFMGGHTNIRLAKLTAWLAQHVGRCNGAVDFHLDAPIEVITELQRIKAALEEVIVE